MKPLKNLWLGATVEGQKTSFRIHDLLNTPSCVRFISYEPALFPLNINQKYIDYSVPTTYDYRGIGIEYTDPRNDFIGLDWVICGPETGNNVRPMKKEWIESIYEQCKKSEVPFYDKKDILKKNLKQFPDGL